jgi:hypothetical protein
MMNPRLATSILLTACLSGLAIAQTTVSVPCNLDNSLYENGAGSVSNGAGTRIFVGLNVSALRRRALVRFDVAGTLPANAKIVSATLTINAVMSTVALPAPMAVHRVTQSWGEGTSVATSGQGGGAAATAGDATWLHRFFPGTLWTTPGGDFVPTPSFTMPLPSLGVGTSTPNAGANADVQFWVDNPSQNFGWLLKLDELLASTARALDSRESTGVRPTLSVTYLLPGQATDVGSGCPVGAGNFTNSWVGAPIGGTTVQVAHTNAPANSVGVVLFALTFDPAGAPLPLPGCSIYLPLNALVSGPVILTSSTGTSSAPFVVPAGFPGFFVNAQTAVIDNNLLGFVVSNAAIACLQ